MENFEQAFEKDEVMRFYFFGLKTLLQFFFILKILSSVKKKNSINQNLIIDLWESNVKTTCYRICDHPYAYEYETN